MVVDLLWGSSKIDTSARRNVTQERGSAPGASSALCLEKHPFGTDLGLKGIQSSPRPAARDGMEQETLRVLDFAQRSRDQRVRRRKIRKYAFLASKKKCFFTRGR